MAFAASPLLRSRMPASKVWQPRGGGGRSPDRLFLAPVIKVVVMCSSIWRNSGSLADDPTAVASATGLPAWAPMLGSSWTDLRCVGLQIGHLGVYPAMRARPFAVE